MAYNTMTYEYILHSMMDRVKASYPNIDTREGSIIFNALAPAAAELAILYINLDNVLKESFVNTASREFLLIACSQMGMDTTVFHASNGFHKGVFNEPVPTGSRWNCESYNYEVYDFIELDEDNNYQYILRCETLGSIPNYVVGDLTPISYITNTLTYAKLTECLIEGEDETSDQDIKIAYYNYVNNIGVDGTVSQYERWCSDYNGIGGCKVIPHWNGDINAVKVSILSSSNNIASDELIAEFQEYLDPGSRGMGDGVAPIGAKVTVSTAEEVEINVTANVTMKPGYTDTSVINNALDQYFSDIAYKQNKVAYMNVGAVILGVDGVESINELRLNNSIEDIALGEEQIPAVGTTNWVVS